LDDLKKNLTSNKLTQQEETILALLKTVTTNKSGAVQEKKHSAKLLARNKGPQLGKKREKGKNQTSFSYLGFALIE
jgi:hypothetical protein